MAVPTPEMLQKAVEQDKALGRLVDPEDVDARVDGGGVGEEVVRFQQDDFVLGSPFHSLLSSAPLPAARSPPRRTSLATLNARTNLHFPAALQPTNRLPESLRTCQGQELQQLYAAGAAKEGEINWRVDLDGEIFCEERVVVEVWAEDQVEDRARELDNPFVLLREQQDIRKLVLHGTGRSNLMAMVMSSPTRRALLCRLVGPSHEVEVSLIVTKQDCIFTPSFLAAEIPLCPKWPYPEASHVESFISGGYLNFPPPLDETLLRMANSYSGQICPVLPLSSFEPSLAQVLLSRPLEGLDIRLTKIGTADLVSTKVVLETPTQLRAMKAKKDSSHWWGTAVRVQGGDTPYKMVYALRFVKEGGGGAEVQELMRKVLEGKEGGFNPVELMPRRDGRLRSFDVPVGTRQMSKDGQFGVCVESFAGGYGGGVAAVFRVVEDAGGSELAACQSVFGFTAATPSLPLAARLKVLSMLAPVTGVRISAVPRSAPKITTSSKSSSSSSASRPTSAGSSSSARRLSLTSTSSSTASAATRTGTSLPATSSNSNNSSTEALSLLAPNSSYRFPTASYDPSTSLAKHPGLVELLTRPQYEVVLAVDETASALKKALTGVEGIGKEEAHFVVEELRRRMGEERRKQKEWEGSWASVVTPAVERIKQEVEGRAAQRTAEQKASLSGSGRTGRPF